MIRLLIADDEKLERDALTEMVARRFDEHQVGKRFVRWQMRSE